MCPTQNSYLFRKNCWNAGQTITLEVPAGNVASAQSAAADWNFYLEQDASAPRFAVSTTSGSVLVTSTGTTSTDEFCGTFDVDNLSWVVITGSLSCNQGASTGTWGAALRQELVGIIGWGENVEQAPDRFQQGLTTHCVAHLSKNPRVINGQVCVHEAEGVVLAYRNLESLVTDPDNFWRDSVYMHARVKGPVGTITVGDTIAVLADTFYSGGFGSGGIPAQMAASGHIPIAKPTNGQVLYSSNNTPVLAQVSGGLFRAVTAGSAFVRARPSSGPSTLTRWWLPFKERGDSIALTVAAAPPPPPPPFVVTTPQTPIITSGNHTFTSHLAGPSTTVYWQVDDSRTIGTDPDTVFTTIGSNSAVLPVSAGSYTLRFRVSLMPNPQYPYSWQIQDIPVCTTDVPALHSGDKSGGGSTEAVENCPPPGEQ